LFLVGSIGEIICHIVTTVALKIYYDKKEGKYD